MITHSPVGALPGCLLHADDTLLDLQCCVDSQALNTRHLLEVMQAAEAGGEISLDDWRHVRRHVRLEHSLNEEAQSLTKWLRFGFERTTALVRSYRGALQSLRAARQGSSQRCPTGQEEASH
jgi:hypothetical protein